MPVTVKIEPSQTQPQAAVIPDASPFNDGVMTKEMAAALAALAASRPPIPQTKKALQNGVATELFTVDIAKCGDNSFASTMSFGCEVTNDTDVQIRSGTVNANVAFKPPSTYATGQAQSGTASVTAGTLTVAFSWSIAGSLATLRATPTSSLSGITDAHINYYVNFATHPGAVSAA